MLRLKSRQRGLLADKLMDAANLAVGGLVFGQLVMGDVFSLKSALVGLAVWVVLSFIALMISPKEAS